LGEVSGAHGGGCKGRIVEDQARKMRRKARGMVHRFLRGGRMRAIHKQKPCRKIKIKISLKRMKLVRVTWRTGFVRECHMEAMDMFHGVTEVANGEPEAFFGSIANPIDKVYHPMTVRF
jgi:hypothetical protein